MYPQNFSIVFILTSRQSPLEWIIMTKNDWFPNDDWFPGENSSPKRPFPSFPFRINKGLWRREEPLFCSLCCFLPWRSFIRIISGTTPKDTEPFSGPGSLPECPFRGRVSDLRRPPVAESLRSQEEPESSLPRTGGASRSEGGRIRHCGGGAVPRRHQRSGHDRGVDHGSPVLSRHSLRRG